MKCAMTVAAKHKQKITKTCEMCGKSFVTDTSRQQQKTCSKKCWVDVQRLKRKARELNTQYGNPNHPDARSCEICGKTFVNDRQRSICSSKCLRVFYDRHRQASKDKTCVTCGKTFKVNCFHSKRKTCSETCSRKLIGSFSKTKDFSRFIVWHTLVCVFCGKEFKLKGKQFDSRRKTCSRKCFRNLSRINGYNMPLFSPETYKMIGEKSAANPKTGHFVTNINAKDYSLTRPPGEVFIFRNMSYFTDNYWDVILNTSRSQMTNGKAKARWKLEMILPWRANVIHTWNEWKWYDPSVGYQPMRKVILSLGSNIEPRREWIEKAVQEIAALPDIRDLRQSPLYETAPEDVPEEFRDQPFLNGIVTFETRVPCPREFLKILQAIEDRLGRTRDGVHGSPRTIDIDIIDIELMRVIRPELVVPHPRAAKRRFVLQPLVDLLPDHRLFRHDGTVSELLQQLATP
ncbi:MAG: 2-amino-4-hydroxy-6-hydroxymethyldihydropteridine diphosphokinase [Kiritimatiellaeota bacterium]|nr:2-amino-4-hydroxy-6-hydroxymethyldihydropteridine diphosphokinase [Kiritimatiellota bacterium]